MLSLKLASLATTLALSLTSVTPVFAQQSYQLVDNYSGSSFFDGFKFFTGGDPTHGTVTYVDKQTAQNQQLISTPSDGHVYIYSDSKTVLTGNQNRNSVRLTSLKQYSSGLFVFDVVHVPFGCGTWPALWLVGNEGNGWPDIGEIDIFEGANAGQYNQMTLHTNDGCTMPSTSSNMTGKLVGTNCIGNNGCGITDSSTLSYGDGFNKNGGGVFAATFENDGIGIWFFARNNVPGDLNAGTPRPQGWGKPSAWFPLGANCPRSHFAPQNIIIDNTFCGDWAGNAFNTGSCTQYVNTPNPWDSCNNFVRSRPEMFKEAYWNINSIKVYQLKNGGGSAPNPVQKTTKTTPKPATPTTTTKAPSPTTTKLTNPPSPTPQPQQQCNCMASCGSAQYNPLSYICLSGNVLCPVSSPNACGKACYDASIYRCCGGTLKSASANC